MKQAINILLAYLTCNDEAVKNKYLNILSSFWHKDDGILVTQVTANNNGDVTFEWKKGDGSTGTQIITNFIMPNEMAISFITGLQTALNTKVTKVIGKQLSTQDFTTTLKNKLDALSNYVHPDFHQIAEIQGLQNLLDDKIDKDGNKVLTDVNFSQADKDKLDTSLQPEVVTPLALNGLSIQNETGVEQFVSTNNIKFKAFDIDAVTGMIISKHPTPLLVRVEPNTAVPNSTLDFIFYGIGLDVDNITASMSLMTINYIQKSVNQYGVPVLKVNATVGAVEGSPVITINNGKQASFYNKIIINQGTVFTPLAADFVNVVGVTPVDGGLDLATFQQSGSAIWNKQFDITKSFIVRVLMDKSPLGDPNVVTSTNKYFELLNVSNDAPVYEIIAFGQPFANRHYFQGTGATGANANYGLIDNTQLFQPNQYPIFEIHWDAVNSILSSRLNGVVKWAFNFQLTENVRLRSQIQSFNTRMQYIELP